jgi:hypothetical protein
MRSGGLATRSPLTTVMTVGHPFDRPAVQVMPVELVPPRLVSNGLAAVRF